METGLAREANFPRRKSVHSCWQQRFPGSREQQRARRERSGAGGTGSAGSRDGLQGDTGDKKQNSAVTRQARLHKTRVIYPARSGTGLVPGKAIRGAEGGALCSSPPVTRLPCLNTAPGKAGPSGKGGADSAALLQVEAFSFPSSTSRACAAV